MTTLKNVHKAPLGVLDADKKHIEIKPGETVDVKGDFSEHIFAKAGWLEVSGNDQPKQDSKKQDAVIVEDITEEGEEFTVRASDGVVFSPAKNQVREDGTLTNGGLKAHAEAKAEAEQDDAE